MKSLKLTFAAICVVLMVGFAGIPKTMAYDCPAGYTHLFFDAIYTSKGCEIHVDFCVQCETGGIITGGDITNVHWYFTDHCDYPGPFDTSDFREWLEKQLLAHAGDYCTIPDCSQVDRDHRPIYSIRTPLCARMHNYPYVDHGVNKNTLIPEMESCLPGSECVTSYRLCRDYSTTPPSIIYDKLSTNLTNPSACSTTKPDMPPTGYTWDDEWVTDCYRMFSCP